MNSTSSAVGARCASAISTESNTDRAVQGVCRQARLALDAVPTLAMVFVSHHHGPDLGPVAARIAELTGSEHLIGCTGESIIGTGQEIEGRPALSLWLAHLPGAVVASMHLEFEQTAEGGTFVGWPDDLPDPWPSGAALITLGEPFSFPVDPFLARMNEDHAGVPVVGGMASGAWGPVAVHLQRARHAAIRPAAPRRRPDSRAPRRAADRGLLRSGRTRPDRRPQLHSRVHREPCPL